MKKIILPSLVLLFSLSSQAQEIVASVEHNSTKGAFSTPFDTIKNKKGHILKEVTVTSNKLQKPVSASRSGIKPMDLPQSVQVIDGQVIEQQQAIRLSEVIKNANGVYVGSARGGAQESFWSRGYDMGANNMFKNGFRFNSGSIPEVASLEKVEFLKGGSALLYGNVAPGGILNLVTKTPKFTRGGEISMQTGSYNYYKPTLDFYGPLNNSIAYRFVGSYENAKSFRDYVKNERFYFNPSFLFKISEKTQITAQGDYLNADWTPDFGTGIVGTEILDIPRNINFGALWSTGNTKSASASVLFNHDFNDNWKLSFNSSFQNYNRTQLSTAQLSNLAFTTNNGVQEVNWKRGLTRNKNLERIFGDQLSLQGIFNTGSIKHQIFTGADWENSIASSYTFGFYNPDSPETLITTETDPTNLLDYSYDGQSTIVPFPSRTTRLVVTDSKRFGAYFQDLISITDYIKVLAGIRWSWQESQATTTSELIAKNQVTNKNEIKIAYENATPTAAAKRLDNAFSPKVGLVLQPTKEISLFGSYSNSFTPNTGNTYGGEPLKPSIIDQYEAGIKTDLFKGILSTNVTVYRIKNNNLVQTAAFMQDGVTPNTNTDIKIMSGETKSDGVEVDVTARPFEGFNIHAGYSYNDMRYTKTSGLNGSFIEGDRVARTPQNTANLSFFYKIPSGILKGVSVGAIGNYIGDRIGGWNNQYDSTKPGGIWYREIPVKGYTTVDVSAGYEWKKFSILCKLSNITNELNYTVHENYSVNPIAPRQVMASLKYKL
ncbi:TonB-dependent siderophore receptor [Flavobacterium seoulense]|uniref:TonB-denpendent receptor n=1 Tax=Flavobacterium seoulense TaxID=1492738 RepID=A0A066WQI5_9FLAO|nr:TonB-dependent receptor [Flavobacterium seoulense]KDN56106.1 TonB-denpendent receptor [Flavobacterium seoulense]